MGWLTCATHIYGDHCIAGRQKRSLELEVDEVDWAAISEILERPAQPHAPHVPVQQDSGAEGWRIEGQSCDAILMLHALKKQSEHMRLLW